MLNHCSAHVLIKSTCIQNGPYLLSHCMFLNFLSRIYSKEKNVCFHNLSSKYLFCPMSSSRLISQSLQAPGFILVYRDGNYGEFNDYGSKFRSVTVALKILFVIFGIYNVQCLIKQDSCCYLLNILFKSVGSVRN